MSRRNKLTGEGRQASCGLDERIFEISINRPTTLVTTIIDPEGRGGTFTLSQGADKRIWHSAAFILQEENSGWRLSDRRSDGHFYWMEKSDVDSPCGFYFACPMCPGDGHAIVGEDAGVYNEAALNSSVSGNANGTAPQLSDKEM